MELEDAQPEKAQAQKSQGQANAVSEKKSANKQTAQLVDNRASSTSHRNLIQMANNGSDENNMAQLKSMASDYSSKQQSHIQPKTSESPIQRKNDTGLPDNLKSGVENISGMSMDDVKVHRNSDKPAQLNAHAYAQGTDIHLGPGQEKHLPHEAWHVVQQKQGRVKPTTQLKEKININDDDALEKEADVMGAKAAGQLSESDNIVQAKSVNGNGIIQRDKVEIAKAASDVVKAGVAPQEALSGNGFAFGDAVKDLYEWGETIMSFKTGFSGGKLITFIGSTGKTAMNVIAKLSAAKDHVKGTQTQLPTWVPGIGAIAAGIKNAGEMIENETKFSDANKLHELAVEDEEKDTIGKYLSRLNWQFVELGVDLALNIADAITAFVPPPASLVSNTIHSCVDAFKAIGKLYYGFLASREERRAGRVKMDTDSLSKEQLGSVDELISADPNSVYLLIRLKERKDELAQEIESSKGSASKALADNQKELDKVDSKLQTGIEKYNQRLFLFTDIDLDANKLTEDGVSNILNIHKNVAKKILEEAATEKGRLSKIRLFFHKEIKEKILAQVYGGSVPDEVYLAQLESASDPEYFWEKTKAAIKIAANRKRMGSGEITSNLKTLLQENQETFLPGLRKSDGDLFNAECSTNLLAYKLAVDTYMEKMSL
jgi:hypothetical protein